MNPGTHPIPSSRPVTSPQTGPHERLRERVERYLEHRWRQPVPLHTRQAFEAVSDLLEEVPGRALIMDSGCGTGQSSRVLAARHPECVVVGVDRSRHRLARSGRLDLPFRDGHCIWVRAELAAFWQLAVEAGWPVRSHYLLYPNPWPKPGHLQRRWHAHPVFPTLLALGDTIEMRTNWRIYAQEFAISAGIVTGVACSVEPVDATEPLSPFEAKYRASGHALFRVRAGQKKPRTSRGFQEATEVHSS